MGWGPVGHAVVTKLLAKSGGALKITVISEAGPSVLGVGLCGVSRLHG